MEKQELSDKQFQTILRHHVIKDDYRIHGISPARGDWRDSENAWWINLSDIDTYLIQNIGRFVERYASDYLITRNSIEKEILHDRNFSDTIVLFGLRQNGVDSNAFTMSRLLNDGMAEQEYRKVYALHFVHTQNMSSPDMTATLYDVSNANWLGIKRDMKSLTVDGISLTEEGELL